MHHNELVSYIVNQLRSCVVESDIIATLQKNGWHSHDIEEALKAAHTIITSQGQSNLCAVRVDFMGASQHTVVPKHKNIKTYSIIIGAIIFCIAVAVFAYTQYTTSPTVILSRMFEKLPSIQTIQGTAAIAVDARIPENKTFLHNIKRTTSSTALVNEGFSFSITQFIDFTGKNTDSFKTDFSLQYHNSTHLTSPITITLNSFGIGNTVYGKVSGVTNTLSLLFGNSFGDIKFLENQWFSVDKTSSSTDAFKELAQSTLPEKTSSASSDERATSTSKKDKLISIFNTYKEKIISDIENKGEENVGDISTTHLMIILDEAQLKEMLQKISDLTNGGISIEEGSPSIIKSFDVWVGTDYFPYKLEVSMNPDFITKRMDNPDIEIPAIKLVVSDISYNTVLSLTPPQGVKRLEDVMGQVFMNLSGGINSSAMPNGSGIQKK